METITINVNEELAEQFRKKAEEKYGKKKGYLAKAVSEAFMEWLDKKDDLIEQALAVIEKGMKLPDWKYKRRSELYESSSRY